MTARLVEATHRIDASDLARGVCAATDETGRMVSVAAEVVHIPQQPFGGVRTLAICPQCLRRCKHLYIIAGRVRCRLCAGLAYQSQRLDKADRLARRIMELRERVTSPGSIQLVRPHGMHKATFNRIRDELDALEERHWDELERRWPGLFGGV